MTNGLETLVASQAVQEDLLRMPIRENLAETFFHTGSSGFYIPTRRAWREEVPQRLAQNLRTFYDGDGVLRFYSLNAAGFRRHEQAFGRFSGLAFARCVSGEGPLHAAEVTDVTDVSLRSGRTMPLLKLMEIAPEPTSRDLIMSVSDLAHYVQTQQAELELTS